MMPHPSTGVVHLSSAMRPAESTVIVRNFNKGLMQVRSPIGPLAPSVVIRKQIRTPKLELLPARVTPRKGLFLSTLLHTATAATLAALPILFPSWLGRVPSTPRDLDREFEVVYQPLQLPALPGMGEASEGTQIEHARGHKTPDVANLLATAALYTANWPKPDYAAPQEIVSNPPDSSKGVQTIRRPDLAFPPKMTYPLRLPSMVMLPHRAVQGPVAPQLEHREPSNPEALLSFRAGEPPAQIPAPPNDKPKLLLAPVKPVLRETRAVSEPTVPVLADTMGPEVNAQKAAVIINAVHVPPEPAPVIPGAELASRFVIGPSRAATTVATTTPDITSENPASASSSKAGQNLPHVSMENGTGTKAEASDRHSVVASNESSSGVAPPASSSTGTASAAATENKSLPGISISGDMPGSSGPAAATSPIPHGSYALTIISGGSSGGASRDLGVFSRTDTVYTVYIPMTDAGGGPDWSMQYALISPAPAGNGLSNGLLTPPVVLKKVQATVPKTGLTANSGLVFVTGIIDENGKLAASRAIRALDGRARSALNALAQWQFLAAQLNGKQVACKVLIGVSVLPTEEVGK